MYLKQFKIVLTILLMVWATINYGQVSTFPYEESFETGTGDFTALGTNSSWERATPASADIKGAATGSFAWVTNADGDARDEESFLQTRIFDFSALAQDPVLIFSSAYDVDSFDEFTVLMSTEGGVDGTYNKLGSESDPLWYNSANGFVGRTDGVYKQYTHVLTGAAGKSSVLIRFAYKASVNSWYYDGVAIDDVRVLTADQYQDLAIIDVQVPVASATLGATEDISVTVRNLGGSLGLDGININVLFDNQTTNADVLFDNPVFIASGSEQVFDLTGVLDLSTAGNYKFDVTLNFASTNTLSDEVAGNDSVRVATGKMKPLASSELPINQDFTSFTTNISLRESKAVISELYGSPAFLSRRGL